MSDSFAFLSPAAVRPTDGHRPLLRTPVERSHIAAGAQLLTYPLKDQNVRVDSHTDAEDQSSNTRQG